MRRNAPVAKNVNEYLAGVPQPARATLQKVRAAIRAAAPKGATEAISYGMPMFKYKGQLVGYAAFAKHCSLFPGGIVDEFKDEIESELGGYKTSKGTIQFPVDKPLPAALIKKLVKFSAARNELREERKARKK